MPPSCCEAQTEPPAWRAPAAPSRALPRRRHLGGSPGPADDRYHPQRPARPNARWDRSGDGSGLCPPSSTLVPASPHSPTAPALSSLSCIHSPGSLRSLSSSSLSHGPVPVPSLCLTPHSPLARSRFPAPSHPPPTPGGSPLSPAPHSHRPGSPVLSHPSLTDSPGPVPPLSRTPHSPLARPGSPALSRPSLTHGPGPGPARPRSAPAAAWHRK